MPNFSFFWRKHYNEIGNCCMTYPLEGHIYIDPDRAKAAEKFGQKQLVKDFIDISWMHQKGLKWIGWDIQGWLAWTDPNGMLYRIKDLKRNEDGVAFEKEVNEVKSELRPRTHQGNPSAEELYRFERDMQANCGFCPGERRGSVDPEVDKEPGMDAKEDEKEFSPFEPFNFNPIIDTEEVTSDVLVVTPTAPDYGVYIEYTPEKFDGGGYSSEPYIPVDLVPVGVPVADPVPKLPPTTSPPQAPPTPSPKIPKHATDNGGITETGATQRIQSPFEVIMGGRTTMIVDYEWNPTVNEPKVPKPVGTYNPTPTVPKNPKKPVDCQELKEAAAMAEGAYNRNPPPGTIGKWREANDELPDDVKKLLKKYAGSGIGVKLYKRDNNGKTEYAVSFRGSDLEINDWFNNVQQLRGVSLQYWLASQIAIAMNRFAAKQGAPLKFVGHSLGGGLASLASLVAGRPAITFNAAGLSTTTKMRYGVADEQPQIQAFIVTNEALNSLQKLGGLQAEGTKTYLKLPEDSAWGDFKTAVESLGDPLITMISKKGPRHMMDAVFAAISRYCP